MRALTASIPYESRPGNPWEIYERRAGFGIYEQGRRTTSASFSELEEQLCGFAPDMKGPRGPCRRICLGRDVSMRAAKCPADFLNEADNDKSMT